MHIGIYWKNSVGENFTDIFSKSDFEVDCTNRLLIHPVAEKTKTTGFAFCLMTVKENEAWLDYRPFPFSNSSEGMELGLLFLRFEDRSNNLSVVEYSWQKNNSDNFEKIDFEQTQPKRRAKAPKRIYDLLQNECFSDEFKYTEEINSAFSTLPKKVTTSTTVFVRNPVVVNLALKRAQGVCEICEQPAPFIKKVTGEPYLEVHHVVPLAEGGEDLVQNVKAICPNCHREQHYGMEGSYNRK